MNSSFAWRTPFIILSWFALVFAAASAVWLVPSPRWLTLRGRHAEVSAAWDILGVGQAEREKTEIELQAMSDRAQGSADSNDSVRRHDASPTDSSSLVTKSGFFDVLAQDVRWRTGLAVFLLGMQQFSGIDGVLYVSSFNFLVHT